MVEQNAVILPAPPQPPDQWSRNYANQLYRWMESLQRQVTGYPYLRGSGLFFPENALPTSDVGLIPGTVFLGGPALLVAGIGGEIPAGYIPDDLPPNKAYRQGNILGTVTEAAGVPTGALIERGTNANGFYIRFADGTQICWRIGAAVAVPASVTAAAGAVTLPIAFANTNYTVLAQANDWSVGDNFSGGTGRVSGKTTTTFSLDVRYISGFNSGGSAGNVLFNYIATGRWF